MRQAREEIRKKHAWAVEEEDDEEEKPKRRCNMIRLPNITLFHAPLVHVYGDIVLVAVGAWLGAVALVTWPHLLWSLLMRILSLIYGAVRAVVCKLCCCRKKKSDSVLPETEGEETTTPKSPATPSR